jgi:hypothetical protein
VLWPCVVLCASMPLRTGDMGAWIYVERGLGGIVVVSPITVEVWLSSWWNDRGHVGSGRGSRAPVGCAWSRAMVWRAPVAHRPARGFHTFFGCGRSKLRGSGTLMTSWGLGRGGKCHLRRPSCLRPLCKALGGMKFVVRAASD